MSPRLHPPKTNSFLEMHVKQPRSSRRPQAAPYPRLTTPLVRDASGVLRPASWDTALDAAAEGFRRNLVQKGRMATGIFSCSKSTNEVNFLASKMARQVFGNNNVDSCNRT
jgi:predicted molibdopterin-dependent oxidoreductase YjgC